MNQSASHLAIERSSVKLQIRIGFKVREGTEKRKLSSKKSLVLGKVILLRGNRRSLSADLFLMLTRKFQFGWLKVKFLGKIETVISYVLSLGLLMWEPNKDDSIWGLLCITPSKA